MIAIPNRKTRTIAASETVGGSVITTNKKNIINTMLMNKIDNRDKKFQTSLLSSFKEELDEYVIDGTVFYYANYDQIKKMATYAVKNKFEQGFDSINDPKGCCLNDHVLCSTCNQTNADCPGHYGMIEFPVPIMNADLQKICLYTLTCFCLDCGELLVDEQTARSQGIFKYEGVTRLKEYYKISKGKMCLNKQNKDNKNIEKCEQNPELKALDKNKNYQIMKLGNKKKNIDDIPFPFLEIEKILKNISLKDKITIGYSKYSNPDACIMRALLTLPYSVRPTIVMGGTSLKDQLTDIYQVIAELCNKVRKNMNSTDTEAAAEYMKDYKNLVFHVNHLLNNSDNLLKSGAQHKIIVKDIKKRISNKKECIRGNAMGRKSNYCGRTVLNPNKYLQFGQASAPQRWRKILTVEERLTKYNYNQLMKLYDEGQIVRFVPYKGKLKGVTMTINDNTREKYKSLIQIGDTFHRWSRNGDSIIFNRQPTLMKFCYLGYDVVFTPNEVTGLHSTSTPPHNADFDGDEGVTLMNQSIGERVEAKYLGHVSKNIMSNHSNKPITGLVFMCPAATYMMTAFDDLMLDDDEWKEATSLFIQDDYFKERLSSFHQRLAKHGVRPKSPRALLSLLFPVDFTYTNGKGDEAVEIKDGIVKKGIVLKKHIGPTHNSIVHYLHIEYHPKFTARFFTEGQFICDWFVEWHGLSLGYSDCYPTPENKIIIENIVNKDVLKAELEIKAMGPDTKYMSQLEIEKRNEKKIIIMNNSANPGKKISIKAMNPRSGLPILCMSGAKGSDQNISQIAGLVGPPFITGKLQPKTVSNGKRLYPWISENDTSIESIGYIKENFNDGLSPESFYLHANCGREGLVNTASKTSKVGDMQHKLCKVLEDLKVEYDNSIRNNNGTIFQYIIDDGFKTDELINVNTKTGSIVSFIDLENIGQKLNMRNGYEKINGKYVKI